MISPYKMWVNGTEIGSVGGKLMTLKRASFPVKRFKTYTIPGRSGFVTKWLGDYEKITREIVVGCEQKDMGRVESMLNQISEVRFSDEPSLVFYCIRSTIVEVESLNLLERLLKFSLECQPEKGVVSESLTNPGNARSYPRISVTGNGTLTVNGTTITIANNTGTLVLDSWLQQASINGVNAWERINVNKLPVTEEGQNLSVSGTVTISKVEPQWRRL